MDPGTLPSGHDDLAPTHALPQSLAETSSALLPSSQDFALEMVALGRPQSGVFHYAAKVHRLAQKDVISTTRFTWLDRRLFRGQFHEVTHREMEDIPFVDIFDNGGLIRLWLLANKHHKGDGLWGAEINDGRLLYLWDLDATSPHADTIMLSIARTYESYNDILIVRPSSLTAREYYRRSGFRRIGRTPFFALPIIQVFQSNPAPTLDDCGGVKPFPLTRTKDGKFPINPYLQHDPTVSTLELAASAEQRKQLYPLHAAIDKYRKADVETRIKHYYQQDPDSIHEPDDHGVRPIFAAIIRRNVRAVRVLLKLGVGEDLRCRENVFRLAPIEWNARELTFVREWHLRPSSGISWDGSEDQRLEIQWLLKRRRKKKLRAVEQPLAGYVAQRKWGCNCGNCLGGWLSPRMISRIKALKVYKESEITKQRTKMTDIITSFLPLYLKRQGLSRKFYAGYRLVFREIAEFLSNDKLTNYFKSKRPATNETNHASAANAVPALQPRVVSLTLTPSAMEDPSLPFLADALAHFLLPTSARAPSETLVISHYTRTGGKAEYALDCLLMLTQNDSSAEVAATQKQHANVMAGLPVLPGSPRSRSGIKRCVNDYAYELVRQRIGLSKNETWGPYLLKMPQVYNTSKRPLSVDISRASSPITPITGGEKHDLTTEDASSGTTASCNADDVLSQTSVHSPAPDQAFPLDAGARTSITKAAAKKRGMDRTENLATSVTSIAPFPVLSRELGHDNDIFTTEEGRPENLTTSMDGMMENEPSALPSTGLLNRKSKRRLEDEEVAPQVKQRRTTGADGEGSHASPTVTNMPMLGTNASAPNERALTVQEEEAPRSEANTVEPNPTEFVLGVVGTPHRWPCIPVPENIMPKFGCSSLPTPKVSMFSHVFVAKSQPRNDGHI